MLRSGAPVQSESLTKGNFLLSISNRSGLFLFILCPGSP